MPGILFRIIVRNESLAASFIIVQVFISGFYNQIFAELIGIASVSFIFQKLFGVQDVTPALINLILRVFLNMSLFFKKKSVFVVGVGV